MPNLCNNYLELKGEIEDIKKIKEAIEEGNFFNYVKPMPEGYSENGKWKNWSIENWGTKWEALIEMFPEEFEVDDYSLSILFYSAWNPPIKIYDELEKIGIDVFALFNEPGMGFCGYYKNRIENRIDYESFDEIPEDIKDRFSIEEF